MSERPEIVVLCGSTRFMDEFRAENLRLTLEGRIVLSVGCDTKSDDALGITDEQKVMLDRLHKRKIDLADRVLVINPDGYLGASTRSEIRYAWSVAHKPVSFTWHMPDEHHDGQMHGLCNHGEPRGSCPGINSYDILETGPHDHLWSTHRDRTTCRLCGLASPSTSPEQDEQREAPAAVACKHGNTEPHYLRFTTGTTARCPGPVSLEQQEAINGPDPDGPTFADEWGDQ